MFVQQQNATPSNIVAFNFLLIAFLTGIASAFQTPTLSLYLSQEIQVSPFFVGLFYSVNAIIGIILSQISRKNILISKMTVAKWWLFAVWLLCLAVWFLLIAEIIMCWLLSAQRY